jgi:DNA modification methylase
MVDTSEGWRSRIVGHDSVPPFELTANPRNWRKHPKAQQQALADVLDRVGWVQDVIVNKRTGLLVDGHARLELALRRGEESVPVVYVDLEPDEEALVLATLDPLSAMAEADDEALRALMADVVADGALAGMLAELAGTTEPKVGKTDQDDVPNIDDVAIYVNRGDIYRLGAHRLMCGDSTSAEDVALLMDGERADLVFTDPPYGVAVAGRGGVSARSSAEARSKGGMTIKNDDLDLEALTDLLRAAFKNILDGTKPGACWYVCAPHGPMGLAFSVALAETGVWKHSLVWVKDSLVMGRMDYHYRHESIYYGWTPGAAHHALEDRKQDTVWEFPLPNRSAEHPTMKPVALVRKAIANSSDVGDAVLDLFAGSGSTLIASEDEDRVCYAMELDPKYAQTVIARWEDYTGGKAEKVDATQLEA